MRIILFGVHIRVSHSPKPTYVLRFGDVSCPVFWQGGLKMLTLTCFQFDFLAREKGPEHKNLLPSYRRTGERD